MCIAHYVHAYLHEINLVYACFASISLSSPSGLALLLLSGSQGFRLLYHGPKSRVWACEATSSGRTVALKSYMRSELNESEKEKVLSEGAPQVFSQPSLCLSPVFFPERHLYRWSAPFTGVQAVPI